MPNSEILPPEDGQSKETKLKDQPKINSIRPTHLLPLGYKPSRIIRRERKVQS